jgi:hypothetical protein
VQTDINGCTIKNGKERLEKTEQSGSSPFRRQISALDCSAIEEKMKKKTKKKKNKKAKKKKKKTALPTS